MQGLIDRHSDSDADTTTIDFFRAVARSENLSTTKVAFVDNFPARMDSKTILTFEVAVGLEALFVFLRRLAWNCTGGGILKKIFSA